MTKKHIAELALAVCVCLNPSINAEVPQTESQPQRVLVDGVWYPLEYQSGCGTSTDSRQPPITQHSATQVQPGDNVVVSPVEEFAPVAPPVEEVASQFESNTEPAPIQVLPAPSQRSFKLAQPTQELTQVQTIERPADEDFQVHTGTFEQEPEPAAVAKTEEVQRPSVEFDTEPTVEVVETESVEETVDNFVEFEPEPEVEPVVKAAVPTFDFAVPAEVETVVAPLKEETVERYNDTFVQQETTFDFPQEPVATTQVNEVVETPVVHETVEETTQVDSFVADAAPVVEVNTNRDVAVNPAATAVASVRGATNKAAPTKARGIWAWWPLALLPLIGWGVWRFFGGAAQEETATYAAYDGQSTVASSGKAHGETRSSTTSAGTTYAAGTKTSTGYQQIPTVPVTTETTTPSRTMGGTSYTATNLTPDATDVNVGEHDSTTTYTGTGQRSYGSSVSTPDAKSTDSNADHYVSSSSTEGYKTTTGSECENGTYVPAQGRQVEGEDYDHSNGTASHSRRTIVHRTSLASPTISGKSKAWIKTALRCYTQTGSTVSSSCETPKRHSCSRFSATLDQTIVP